MQTSSRNLGGRLLEVTVAERQLLANMKQASHCGRRKLT